MAAMKIVQSVVVKQMLAFLEKDHENNIKKIINLLEKFDKRGKGKEFRTGNIDRGLRGSDRFKER